MSNYNIQLQSNNVDLQEVLQNLQNKAAGSEQATPVISVNSTNGLITATAGAKTSTHQLAFQPAKTITPSTASQVAVSSGYYTGGNITVAAVPTQTKSVTPKATSQNVTPDSGKFLSKVTVAGDSNLVAGNIKNGVSIFGVSGTLDSGGSGEQVEWSANEDAVISGNISGSYFNDRVKTIRTSAFCGCTSLTTANFPACTDICANAFYGCTSLTTANFPACTIIYAGAFRSCTSLTTANFPACTIIRANAFESCKSLTTANFPACTIIRANAFYGCTSLTTANFPACTDIGSYAFYSCFYLKSLYLTGSSLCKLSTAAAFEFTPIRGYSASAGTYGSIFVPASLLTSYQTATNWTYFSSRFVGVNDMITFTIDDVPYQAEGFMTWLQWCDSEYNTDQYYCNKNSVEINLQDGKYTLVNYHGDIVGVHPDEVILENVNYVKSYFGFEA